MLIKNEFGLGSGCSKVLLFFGLILISFKSLAQEDNRIKNIDVLPPSPSVAKLNLLTRPDVGLSSGAAKFHIPLTSLKVGGYDFSASMDYVSNGVKVDDVPSKGGVGFQFSAGGVVSRVVNGRGPDEHYDFESKPEGAAPDSRTFLDYVKRNYSGTDDPGRDVFSFSFGNEHGQFVLNNNKEPVLIPKSNLKVEVSLSNSAEWNVKITDESGNQFFFGGSGFVEKSKKPLGCGKTYDQFKPTAWFLKSVLLYSGDTVNFTYKPHSYSYFLGRYETMYWADPAQPKPSTEEGAPCGCPEYNGTTCVSFLDTDTKYLTGIYSSQGDSIIFSYQDDLTNSDVLLKGVKKYINGRIIDNYKLSYGNYAKRFFLEKIVKYGNFLNPLDSIPYYSFEYYNPQGLPDRLSYAQDEWGYYNGKENNTLVPKPSTPTLIEEFPYATADRSVDTLLSKYGLLTKISYPTGGYDQIKYEPNKVYKKKSFYDIKDTTSSITVQGISDNTLVEVDDELQIPFQQEVDFHIWVTNTTGDFYRGAGGAITVTDSNGNVLLTIGQQPGSSLGVSNDTTSQLTLDSGQYNLRYMASGQTCKLQSQLNYTLLKDTIIQEKNWPIGGSRVESISSFSGSGEFLTSKKFLYHKMGDSRSSGVVPERIHHAQSKNFTVWCSDYHDPSSMTQGDVCNSSKCSYESLLSSSTGNVLTKSGNSVNYQTVMIQQQSGNDVEITEHNFALNNDAPGAPLLGEYAIGGLISNSSVMNNGQETKMVKYEKEGESFIPVEENNFYYDVSDENFDALDGFVINKNGSACATTDLDYVEDIELDPWVVTQYETFSPWLVLDSVVNIKYSRTKNDIQLKDKVIYHYDITSLQRDTTEKVDSKGRVHKYVHFYTNMYPNIPSTSYTQGVMLSQAEMDHLTNFLIYEKEIVNGEFVNDYRLLLDDHNSPNNKIKPYQAIVRYDENDTGQKFTIQKYDQFGNIAQKETQAGIQLSYLWDFKGKYPVAESKGSSLQNIAYTGFETDNLGQWAISGDYDKIQDNKSPMGEYYAQFTSNSVLTKGGLDANITYQVSYWHKGSASISISGATHVNSRTGLNGWVNTTCLVQGVASISVNAANGVLMDDLRLHPSKSLMKSYSYLPGIGVKSIADENNNITYFEYDAFGRLKIVKDGEGNILKMYNYHYKSSSAQ